MDPNANLEEQTRIVKRLLSGEAGSEEMEELAIRLAELVEGMDEWVSRGGFLPARWAKS